MEKRIFQTRQFKREVDGLLKKRLFKNLKAGLEDVAAHQRGELELYSEKIVIPEPPLNTNQSKSKKSAR